MVAICRLSCWCVRFFLPLSVLLVCGSKVVGSWFNFQPQFLSATFNTISTQPLQRACLSLQLWGLFTFLTLPSLLRIPAPFMRGPPHDRENLTDAPIHRYIPDVSVAPPDRPRTNYLRLKSASV